MKFKYPQKEKFGNYPTPIIPIIRFFENSPKYKFWIKRDDLTGMELSGNKVRKLEYLFADALSKKSNHLITCGGIQSNHCRTTAFLASRLKFNCTLFLKGRKPNYVTGNYLLNTILNTNIRTVSDDEYQRIDSLMEKYGTDLDETIYVIPEGGSNEIGVWGYIECFFEILEQLRKQNLKIDTIVVSTGSGGTHAGLLLGKKLAISNIEIISVNVCDSADYFINKIKNICDRFSTIYKIAANITENDVKVIDGFVGEGYGMVTEKEIIIIKKFAQAEGIIIDPVYTAKTIIGLENLVREKALPGKNILFIHTGGIFGLFPFADRF